VVLGDGEHHNATDTTWDFLGDRDRILSLRLCNNAARAADLSPQTTARSVLRTERS